MEPRRVVDLVNEWRPEFGPNRGVTPLGGGSMCVRQVANSWWKTVVTHLFREVEASTWSSDELNHLRWLSRPDRISAGKRTLNLLRTAELTGTQSFPRFLMGCYDLRLSLAMLASFLLMGHAASESFFIYLRTEGREMAELCETNWRLWWVWLSGVPSRCTTLCDAQQDGYTPLASPSHTHTHAHVVLMNRLTANRGNATLWGREKAGKKKKTKTLKTSIKTDMFSYPPSRQH